MRGFNRYHGERRDVTHEADPADLNGIFLFVVAVFVFLFIRRRFVVRHGASY